MRLVNFQAELTGDVIPECRGSHFRDRESAGCDHKRGRVKLREFGMHDELRCMADLTDSAIEKYFYSRIPTFRFEHVGNIARRAVAEELSEGFFVEGDAMLLDQSNKVGRCISGQRRFRKVRVCRDEIIRLAMNVGEITASSARNKNFLANALGALDDR